MVKYFNGLSNRAIIVGAIAGTAGVLGLLWLRRSRKKDPRILELQKSHVHIADPDRVTDLIQTFIDGGKQKLQVIADFDNTLSRYACNGTKCLSTHNVLEVSHLMPSSFNERSKEVHSKYYSIEIDPSKTMEEKFPYMVEWWTKAHDLLLEYNLTQQTLRQAVEESNLMLKEDYNLLFGQLIRHKVPLLIFSAGLGDIIEEVIKLKSQLYDNIKIVSNYMDFNHHGTLIGFKGDIIHIYNKNESVIKDSTYFERLKKRTNVILLGDSLGDLHMAEGANADHVLKIGYLNYNVEQLLHTYMTKYDIVLVGDETLDVVNGLLRNIL